MAAPVDSTADELLCRRCNHDLRAHSPDGNCLNAVNRWRSRPGMARQRSALAAPYAGGVAQLVKLGLPLSGVSFLPGSDIFLLGLYFRPALLIDCWAGQSTSWSLLAIIRIEATEITSRCVLLTVAGWLVVGRFRRLERRDEAGSESPHGGRIGCNAATASGSIHDSGGFSRSRFETEDGFFKA